MKRIIVSAGGSGGHIIPAVSIIKELNKIGYKTLFIGNKDSMEEEIIKGLDIDFLPIDVQKLYRRFTLAHLKFPFKLLASIHKSRKIISAFKPDAFLGTGGFVSGPAGYAAKLANIPIFLQEQNSFPGLTTRILSPSAKVVFLGNKGAAKFLPKAKTVFTGNPINVGALEERSPMDFATCSMQNDSFKIFLTGGSQGSVILNNALYEIVDRLLAAKIQIFWQVGKYSFKRFDPLLKKKTGVYYFDFTNEMGKIYNSIDMVIARSGALSLGEFETKKIPSLLIPLPSAAENHQYYNAVEFCGKGYGELLEQKDLNSDLLYDKIIDMKENIMKYKSAFNDSIHAKSAKKIAALIDERI